MSPGAWTVLSGTQIGSVHLRDGRPIQDAVRTWAEGDAAVVAVSDGHGHHDHFRSDVGARIAVDCAVDSLVSCLADFTDAAAAQRTVAEVGARMVEAWTVQVRRHVADNPFDGGVGDPLRPYGATVLAMAVVGDALAMFQIGDGDTVVVDSSGRAFRPLPEDPELDGTHTASLCQPNPLRSLRAEAIDVRQRDVVLAFQCTDGFGSSRVDAEGWWQQTGEELVRFGRERGLGWVGEQLPSWLVEPAQVGGDDTTMAIIGRTDIAG